MTSSQPHARVSITLPDGMETVLLPVQAEQIERTYREGDHLVVVLVDGRELLLEGWFARLEEGSEVSLLARDGTSGEVVAVTVTETGEYAGTKPVALARLEEMFGVDADSIEEALQQAGVSAQAETATVGAIPAELAQVMIVGGVLMVGVTAIVITEEGDAPEAEVMEDDSHLGPEFSTEQAEAALLEAAGGEGLDEAQVAAIRATARSVTPRGLDSVHAAEIGATGGHVDFDIDGDGTADRRSVLEWEEGEYVLQTERVDLDFNGTFEADLVREWSSFDSEGRATVETVDEGADGSNNRHMQHVYDEHGRLAETQVSTHQDTGFDGAAVVPESLANAVFQVEIDVNGDSTPETLLVMNPKGSISVVGGEIKVDLQARVPVTGATENEAPDYSAVGMDDRANLESVVVVDASLVDADSDGSPDKIYPVIQAIEVDGTNHALSYDFARDNGLVGIQTQEYEYLDLGRATDASYFIHNGLVEVLGKKYVPFNAIDYEGTVVRVSEYSGDLVVEGAVLTFVDGTMTAANIDGAVAQVANGAIESIETDTTADVILKYGYEPVEGDSLGEGDSGQDMFTSIGYDYNADGTVERTDRYERNVRGHVTKVGYDFDNDGTAERSETYLLQKDWIRGEENVVALEFVDARRGGIDALDIIDQSEHREIAAALQRSLFTGAQIASIQYDDDNDGTMERVEHVSYDDAGRPVEVRMDLDNDGTVDRTETYGYNGRHQIVSAQFHQGENADGTPYLEQTYAYDSYGRIQRIESDVNGDGTAEEIRSFEFDGQGHISAYRLQAGLEIQSEIDGGGFRTVPVYNVDHTEEFERNELGQIVRSQARVEDADPDGYRPFVEYEWDSQGRLVAERHDVLDPSQLSIPGLPPLPPSPQPFEEAYEYEYNAAGQVARRTVLVDADMDGTLEAKAEARFEYDDHGRLYVEVVEGDAEFGNGRPTTTNFYGNGNNFAFRNSLVNKVAYLEDYLGADVGGDRLSDTIGAGGSAGADGTPDDVWGTGDRYADRNGDGTPDDDWHDGNGDGMADDIWRDKGYLFESGFLGTSDSYADGTPDDFWSDINGDGTFDDFMPNEVKFHPGDKIATSPDDSATVVQPGDAIVLDPSDTSMIQAADRHVITDGSVIDVTRGTVWVYDHNGVRMTLRSASDPYTVDADVVDTIVISSSARITIDGGAELQVDLRDTFVIKPDGTMVVQPDGVRDIRPDGTPDAFSDGDIDMFPDGTVDIDPDGTPDDFLGAYDENGNAIGDGTPDLVPGAPDGTADSVSDGTVDDFFDADGTPGADGTPDSDPDGTPDRGSDGTPERLVFSHGEDLTVSSDFFDPARLVGVKEIHLAGERLSHSVSTRFEIADEFLADIAEAEAADGPVEIAVHGHRLLSKDDTIAFKGDGFRRVRYDQDGNSLYADSDGNRLLVERDSVAVSTMFTRMVPELVAAASSGALTAELLASAGGDAAGDSAVGNAEKVIVAFDSAVANVNDPDSRSLLEFIVTGTLPDQTGPNSAVTSAAYDLATGVLTLEINDSGDASGAADRTVRVTFDADSGLSTMAEYVRDGFSTVTETYEYAADRSMAAAIEVDDESIGSLVYSLDASGNTLSDGTADKLALHGDLVLGEHFAQILAGDGISVIDMDRHIPERPFQAEIVGGTYTDDDGAVQTYEGRPEVPARDGVEGTAAHLHISVESLAALADGDGDGTPDPDYALTVHGDQSDTLTLSGDFARARDLDSLLPSFEGLDVHFHAYQSAGGVILVDPSVSTRMENLLATIFSNEITSPPGEGGDTVTRIDTPITDSNGDGTLDTGDSTVDRFEYGSVPVQIEDGEGTVTRVEVRPARVVQLADTDDDGTFDRTTEQRDADRDGTFDRIEHAVYDQATFDGNLDGTFESAFRVVYREFDDDADGVLDRVVFEDGLTYSLNLSVEKAADWAEVSQISLAGGLNGETTLTLSPEAFAVTRGDTDANAPSDAVELYVEGESNDTIRIDLGANGTNGEFFDQDRIRNGYQHYFTIIVNTANQDVSYEIFIDPDIAIIDTTP